MHEVDRVVLLNIFLRKYISIVIQFKTLFLMEKGQAVVQCNQNKMIKSVRDYCVFLDTHLNHIVDCFSHLNGQLTLERQILLHIYFVICLFQIIVMSCTWLQYACFI